MLCIDTSICTPKTIYRQPALRSLTYVDTCLHKSVVICEGCIDYISLQGVKRRIGVKRLYMCKNTVYPLTILKLVIPERTVGDICRAG